MTVESALASMNNRELVARAMAYGWEQRQVDGKAVYVIPGFSRSVKPRLGIECFSYAGFIKEITRMYPELVGKYGPDKSDQGGGGTSGGENTRKRARNTSGSEFSEEESDDSMLVPPPKVQVDSELIPKNVYNFFLFKGMVPKPGTGLIDWFYVMPGVQMKRGKPIGKLNVDYFTSKDELVAYVKHNESFLSEFRIWLAESNSGYSSPHLVKKPRVSRPPDVKVDANARTQRSSSSSDTRPLIQVYEGEDNIYVKPSTIERNQPVQKPLETKQVKTKQVETKRIESETVNVPESQTFTIENIAKKAMESYSSSCRYKPKTISRSLNSNNGVESMENSRSIHTKPVGKGSAKTTISSLVDDYDKSADVFVAKDPSRPVDSFPKTDPVFRTPIERDKGNRTVVQSTVAKPSGAQIRDSNFKSTQDNAWFKGMYVFLLAVDRKEKPDSIRKIAALGGSFVEIREGKPKCTSAMSAIFRTASGNNRFFGVGTVKNIGSPFSLSLLACGIPILNVEFLDVLAKTKSISHWRDYMLPTGCPFMTSWRFNDRFSLEKSPGLFRDVRALVVNSYRASRIKELLLLGGAILVDSLGESPGLLLCDADDKSVESARVVREKEPNVPCFSFDFVILSICHRMYVPYIETIPSILRPPAHIRAEKYRRVGLEEQHIPLEAFYETPSYIVSGEPIEVKGTTFFYDVIRKGDIRIPVGSYVFLKPLGTATQLRVAKLLKIKVKERDKKAGSWVNCALCSEDTVEGKAEFKFLDKTSRPGFLVSLGRLPALVT